MKYLNRFNRCTIGFFLSFQFIIAMIMTNNGRLDFPMSMEEYVAKGGHSFDYYQGYFLFSCYDHTGGADLNDLLFRYVPELLILRLWLLGIGYGFRNNSEGVDIDLVPKKSKPVFVILTTFISCYYIYYSFVYIMKFWLL